MPATKRKPKGRKAGGNNDRGFWYRKGRGWYVTEGGQPVALRDRAGTHIKAADADRDDLQAAYDLHRANRAKPVNTLAETTVAEVCRLYLDHSKATDKPATYSLRRRYLFMGVTGYPAKFLLEKYKDDRKPEDRRHKGLGGLTAGTLTHLDVNELLRAWPEWKDGGAKKIFIQALKRAFFWWAESVKSAANPTPPNPMVGFKAGQTNARVAYFTPEEETALLTHADPAFATALNVLILTGARPGIEFGKLTARHVEESDKGQQWRFNPEESKNHKLRILRLKTGKHAGLNAVIELVRKLKKQYSTGPLFRDELGKPWTSKKLQDKFDKLRRKLAGKGITLGNDSCVYAARHTYAKRELGGYWTGKPCSLEQLAGKMGNSREICWKYYAQWCDSYTDPLWD